MLKIDGKFYEKNKVRQIRCSTWNNFLQEIRKTPAVEEESGEHNFGSGAIFRGHSLPEWTLSSRLERQLAVDAKDATGQPLGGGLRQFNPPEWYPELCATFLQRFKENAFGIPNFDINQEDNEVLALGRHFGLLTPLLDWTTSPYVAAFFAYIDIYRKFQFSAGIPTRFNDGSVHIWGLRLWDNLEEEGIFKLVQVRKQRGSRLWAQRGLFTRLDSRKHLDIGAYLHSRGIAHYLECYQIPNKSAVTALRDLDMMGINLATMFTDLHGAAEQANIESDLFRICMTQVVGGSDEET